MPRYEITGPDGARYEIEAPEGATEQDVMNYAQSQIGQGGGQGEFVPPPVPEGVIVHEESRPLRTDEDWHNYAIEMEARRRAENLGSFGRALTPPAQGVSFGAMDEFIGATAAPLMALKTGNSIADEYAINRDALRYGVEQERREHPVRSAVTEVAGAIPTAAVPLGAAGRVAQSGSLATRAGASGAIGATQGGLYSFAAGEGGFDERLQDAGVGAAVGGGLAAASPFAGQAVRAVAKKAANSKAGQALLEAAPSTDDLRGLANRAYDRAKAAGVAIRPEKMAELSKGISDDLVEAGFNPGSPQTVSRAYPKLALAVDEIQRAVADPDNAPTLSVLRTFAQNAAGSTDAAERRMGSMLVNRLDDFVATLGPDDVSAGNPEALASAWPEARRLWSQMRKSEMIDTAFEKAGNQASGVENGLRIQFRQILNNPRLRRGLTDDEVDAMQKVVQGTVTSNTLRRLGRLFSMGAGQQTNTLNGLLTGGGSVAGGAALGGPVGAAAGLAVPVAGYGAQRGAQALTARQGRLAQALMASGGQAPAPAIPASKGRLAELLLRQNVPVTGPLAAELQR